MASLHFCFVMCVFVYYLIKFREKKIMNRNKISLIIVNTKYVFIAEAIIVKNLCIVQVSNVIIMAYKEIIL